MNTNLAAQSLLTCSQEEQIVSVVSKYWFQWEAIYLFGSFVDGFVRESSDIDLGLLLSHQQANQTGHLAMSPACFELESLLNRDVDLVNLRVCSTVFQAEVIRRGKVLRTAEPLSVAQFEMYTLSAYQKLNQERSVILEAGLRNKRFYNV